MWNQAHPYETMSGAVRCLSHYGIVQSVMLLAVIVLGVGTSIVSAQSLNWEGQDGIYVTPLRTRFRRPTKAWADPLLPITTSTPGQSWADSIRCRSPWEYSIVLSLGTREISIRMAVQLA